MKLKIFKLGSECSDYTIAETKEEAVELTNRELGYTGEEEAYTVGSVVELTELELLDHIIWNEDLNEYMSFKDAILEYGKGVFCCEEM